MYYLDGNYDEIVDIKKNKELIGLLTKETSKVKRDIHIDNLYEDILLLFEFFGNDFIPAIKSIQIDEYSIDILFVSYILALNNYDLTLSQ